MDCCENKALSLSSLGENRIAQRSSGYTLFPFFLSPVLQGQAAMAPLGIFLRVRRIFIFILFFSYSVSTAQSWSTILSCFFHCLLKDYYFQSSLLQSPNLLTPALCYAGAEGIIIALHQHRTWPSDRICLGCFRCALSELQLKVPGINLCPNITE